jgi:hypothetical protein
MVVRTPFSDDPEENMRDTFSKLRDTQGDLGIASMNAIGYLSFLLAAPIPIHYEQRSVYINDVSNERCAFNGRRDFDGHGCGPFSPGAQVHRL